MTIKHAVFAVGLLLTVLVLACSDPDSPAPGRSCNHPGEFYTHYDKHGTVSLTCSRDGVWRKA